MGGAVYSPKEVTVPPVVLHMTVGSLALLTVAVNPIPPPAGSVTDCGLIVMVGRGGAGWVSVPPPQEAATSASRPTATSRTGQLGTMRKFVGIARYRGPRQEQQTRLKNSRKVRGLAVSSRI
jgi:hypothetical protein